MKRYFLNLTLSIQLVILCSIWAAFAVLSKFNNTNLVGRTYAIIFFCLMFVLSLIYLFLKAFHSVTLSPTYITYRKIFTKETILFKDIESVSSVKKTVINSLIFRVPSYEDYFIIMSGQKKIEIPAEKFHYKHEDNVFYIIR